MRILLDVCMPKRLVDLAGSHHVVHASSQGWDRLQNGKLIDAADASFDVLVTVDKDMRFQQSLKGRTLCVAILDVPDTNLETHLAYWAALLEIAEDLVPGQFIVVTAENPNPADHVDDPDS